MFRPKKRVTLARGPGRAVQRDSKLPDSARCAPAGRLQRHWHLCQQGLREGPDSRPTWQRIRTKEGSRNSKEMVKEGILKHLEGRTMEGVKVMQSAFLRWSFLNHVQQLEQNLHTIVDLVLSV